MGGASLTGPCPGTFGLVASASLPNAEPALRRKQSMTLVAC
jgi:hypothetical protein